MTITEIRPAASTVEPEFDVIELPELLARLLAGEQRAFRELVSTYQGAMRAVACAVRLPARVCRAMSSVSVVSNSLLLRRWRAGR